MAAPDETQSQGVAAPVRADAPRPSTPATPVLPQRSPGRGPRWGRWLAGAVVLLAVAWLAWRLFGPAGSGSKHGAGDAAQPVGIAKVGVGDMRVVLTGLGTVTPLATITVQTQISGQLMSVGYQEGQIVRKGDLLAQIDPRPYEIALQQAQGTLAHDKGLLAQARSDLARYALLGRRNSIAQQTVADQEFLVQQYEGTVTEDEASVANARLNLVYCHIVSPVTGRVGLRLVDPGNYVQTSGSTGLVVVTQLQPISVIFVLPEDNVPQVAQEIAASQTLSVTAYDRANTTQIAQGTLLTIDNTVDTTTGTVKLRASFPNADNALFPNQFVNARLLLKTLHQVTQAPTAAIQQGAPGTFVYLVKPDNTVAVQVVKTGITDGDETEIISGVKQGDQVVVDGADRLKDGAKVRVAPDTGNAAATPDNGPGAPPGQQPDNAVAPPGKHKHHHKQSTE